MYKKILSWLHFLVAKVPYPFFLPNFLSFKYSQDINSAKSAGFLCFEHLILAYFLRI